MKLIPAVLSYLSASQHLINISFETITDISDIVATNYNTQWTQALQLIFTKMILNYLFYFCKVSGLCIRWTP